MDKKYELLQEDAIQRYGSTLYRIKALRDFGGVKAGDLGGYVESESNLAHEGTCWVYDTARVCGTARVYGNARVCGNARVYGNAWVCGSAVVSCACHILIVAPLGSRNGCTTFFRTKDGDIGVSCGCFQGNLDEFLAKVEETHGDNRYGAEYRAAAELARVHIQIGEK